MEELLPPQVIARLEKETTPSNLASLYEQLPAEVAAKVQAHLELGSDQTELQQWRKVAKVLASEVVELEEALREFQTHSFARQEQVHKVLDKLKAWTDLDASNNHALSGSLNDRAPSASLDGQSRTVGSTEGSFTERISDGPRSRSPPREQEQTQYLLANNGYVAMLIEDDDFQREAIAAQCTIAGFSSVLKFSSGEEALTALRTGARPHLVICDINLGAKHADGFAILPQMRQLLKNDAAIVMASASVDSETIDRCLVLDADSFVSKPLGKAQLTNLSIHIHRRRRTAQAAEAKKADLRQSIVNMEAEIKSLLPAAAAGSSGRGLRREYPKASPTTASATAGKDADSSEGGNENDDSSSLDQLSRLIPSAVALVGETNLEKAVDLLLPLALVQQRRGSPGVSLEAVRSSPAGRVLRRCPRRICSVPRYLR